MMDLESTVTDLAPRLLRYAVSLTRDWSVAEEVSQDVLAILVERWRRSGPPDSVEAFVFTIARRRARRAGWKRRLLQPLDSIRALSARTPSQLEQAEARESLERAIGLFSTLSRKEAEAIALVALGELSVRRTAEVLGVGESAVKMRVLRARKRLKERMEDDDGTARAGSQTEGRLSDPFGIG